VAPAHFDPFRSRRAREIRNKFSKAFLQALAEKDASFFKERGSAYLRHYPDPVYAGYIRDRLERYEKAYEKSR